MSDKTSDKRLLPCPFCKEELEIVGKGHYYAHKTNGCILQHLCFECDDVEAIERWNTRKTMERIVERLEERHKNHSANIKEFIRNNDLESASKESLMKTECEIAIEIAKEEQKMTKGDT